jgi:hypothetical protein
MRRLVILAVVIAFVAACIVPTVANASYVDHNGFDSDNAHGGSVHAWFQSTAHRWSSWWWAYSEFEGTSGARCVGTTPAAADWLQIDDTWEFNGIAISVSGGASLTPDGPGVDLGATFSYYSDKVQWSARTSGPSAMAHHHFSGVRGKSRVALTSESESCTVTAYWASNNEWVTPTCHG